MSEDVTGDLNRQREGKPHRRQGAWARMWTGSVDVAGESAGNGSAVGSGLSPGPVWPRPGTRNMSGLTVPVALTPLQPEERAAGIKRVASPMVLQPNRIE
jgi:hypothetical protein